MSKVLTTGHLFAGIGGMPLAAQRAGLTPKFFCEIEPYQSAVLAKNFPGVPNYGDVTKFRGEQAGSVDILTGGFPCQDISLAGKGLGIAEGTRSGLWIEFARIIGEIRPRYAIIENVSALRSRGMDRVLTDLSALGYDAEWHCIPASYVGAPHRRDRIWIVAYPHTDDAGLEGRYSTELRERPGQQLAGTLGASLACAERSCAWWDVEPDVGRVANGVPGRVDRLIGLGNSIVPQVAEEIYAAIKAHATGAL